MRIVGYALLSCLAVLTLRAPAAQATTWTLQDFWPRWTRVDEHRVRLGTSHLYRIAREPQLGAGAFSTQVLPHVQPLTSCAGAAVVGYPNTGIDYHLWDSSGYHYLGYVLYHSDCSFQILQVQNPTEIVIIPLTVDDAVGWTSGPLSMATTVRRYTANGEPTGLPVTSLRRFHTKIELDPLATEPVLKIAAWNDDDNCPADTLWLARTSPFGFDQTVFDGQGAVKIVAATGAPFACTLVDYGQFLIWSDPLR